MKSVFIFLIFFEIFLKYFLIVVSLFGKCCSFWSNPTSPIYVFIFNIYVQSKQSNIYIYIYFQHIIYFSLHLLGPIACNVCDGASGLPNLSHFVSQAIQKCISAPSPLAKGKWAKVEKETKRAKPWQKANLQ